MTGLSSSFFWCFLRCSYSTMMVLLMFRSLYSSSRISKREGYCPPSIPIFWNLYLKYCLMGNFLKVERSKMMLFFLFRTKQLTTKYSRSRRSDLCRNYTSFSHSTES